MVTDTGVDEDDWIPAVHAAGMAIITRDKHIQTRYEEIAVVAACGARMFAITSPGVLYGWDLLEIVVTQWRHLEATAEAPGPYVYGLTRTGLNRVDLDDLLANAARARRRQ